MKLREARIKNFRNLVDITVPIGDNTILIGENNSGKTAFLDALSIALSRNPQARKNPFDEYDYHMSKSQDTPQSCEGISIELWFREDTPDEWPASILQAIEALIQLDPFKDIHSIGFRLTSAYDTGTKTFKSACEFLTFEGQPLAPKKNIEEQKRLFFRYVFLHYMAALRDSEKEFSSRSPYWGKILRNLELNEEQRADITSTLKEINEKILSADPKLEKVKNALKNIQHIVTSGINQETTIQALPLQLWELMAKAQVIIKSGTNEIDFPLSQYGQGVQSLAVIFLFQVFIDIVMKPSYHDETEAILALEEPEAHLHPQAARALAHVLENIQSQKIISSHSPYFIQEIPFKDIRLFKCSGPASKVLYVKRELTIPFPKSDDVVQFCNSRGPHYVFDDASSTLIVKTTIPEDDYRKLLRMSGTDREFHARLRELRNESCKYLNDYELNDLETFAKRMRGEILFARAWLLCEGQSEYILLRYFSELSGTPFDQYGIAVIDFQNNGSPGAFVSLALNLEIPWIMLCDNDEAGKGFISQLEKRGITGDLLKEQGRPLPSDGMTLEKYLLLNGFKTEFVSILNGRGIRLTKTPEEPGFLDDIVTELEKTKTESALALVEKLRKDKADASRIPPFFTQAINDIINKAQ